MRSIEVSFSWDEAHYLRAVRANLSSPGGRLFTAFVLVFALFLIGMAIHLAVTAEERTPAVWGLVALYGVVGVGMLFLRGSITTLLVRRRFRQRPDRGKRVTYRFDENGIRGETEGMATSDIAWAMPIRAAVRDDALLVFLTPRQYLYVPLEACAEREQLLALVRAKVKAT
ncbi:MAG: YcxB family protein [Planctomycetota bacterium]